MSNLNKRLLLFLAVLFMFMLIPVSFAANMDDANAVGVDNQLAGDGVLLPATDDAVAQSASVESDLMKTNDCENDFIAAGDGAIYVDGFDGSGGSGTSDNPYHSLKDVLNSTEDLGNEIYVLPGTYDFAGTTANLTDRNFTLTAMGDVTFTSSETLFHKYGTEILTLNGIRFENITSSSSAILYTGSSVVGTLNMNNCSFINNRAANLIDTSYNINIRGCTFIDNAANGTSHTDGGLIDNVFGSPNITVTYSVFIGNNIRFTNNGCSPIIVNGIANPGANVYFDYNFVNNNDPLSEDEIVYNGVLNSYSTTIIEATAPDCVSSGDTVDLKVNFTKSDGNALDDCMPTLNVALVSNVNAATIPVTITNNGAKGQYTAKSDVSYTESVDVKYGEHVLNTFEFYVADGNLLNPELTVPQSLIVDIDASEAIGDTHIGDGVVTYESGDESVATVDANGVVTGVSEGTVTITVSIAPTNTYGGDSKEVEVFVKDPADANVIYVDGFDGSGGRGIKVDPYHSLKDVLADENSGKEIRLMPGTYDFVNIIYLKTNTFVISAYEDDVVFTTTLNHMFDVSEACDVTFKGIKFMDSNVDDAVVTRSYSTAIGTLNFIDCDFINNTGDCLIKSSCNVNIKRCTFIDNNATGAYVSSSGLIHNHYASTNTIDVSYSIFINNEIAYANNGYNPIIVDWNNGNGPAVIFNYNFVNTNNALNNNAIAYHAGSITKAGYAVINGVASGTAYTAHPVNLEVKFTKNGGSALAESIAELNVNLVPTQKTGSIPVTIAGNIGDGQYMAKRGNAYTETVAVKVNDNTLTTFQFNVVKSNKYYTSIAADDLEMTYNDGSSLNVTLTDDQGAAISGATIRFNVNVDGVNKSYTRVTDGNGVASLPVNFTAGTYVVSAAYQGNNNYESSSANATVNVNQAALEINLSADSAYYGDDLVVNVNSADDLAYAFNVTVGNQSKALILDNGAGSVSFSGLAVGQYTIAAVYDGDNNYLPASANASVEVMKSVPRNFIVYAENSFANDVVVYVTCDDELAYRVNVTVAGQSKLLRLKNGEGSLKFNGIEAGTYTVTALYKGDQNHSSVSADASLVMKPAPKNFTVSAKNSGSSDLVVTVKSDDELAYRVNVTVAGQSKLLRLKNGKASVKFTGLEPDRYNVTAIYKGDANHSSASASTIAVIKPVPGNFTVSAENTLGSDVVVTVNSADELAYRVNVTLGNQSKLVRIKDGKGSVKFTGLENGNYTVTALYKGDNNYSPVSVDTNVEVMSNAANLTVSADCVYYGDDLIVNVTSTDELAYRVNVTVGNQSKLLRLKNGSGIVRFSGLAIGNYTITALYKGDENFSAVSVDTNVEVMKPEA